MYEVIDTPKRLGEIVRRVRKEQRVRQDDLAAMSGASHVFVLDVERGKTTVQLGKVLDVLRELGIRLIAEVPESAVASTLMKRSPKRHG